MTYIYTTQLLSSCISAVKTGHIFLFFFQNAQRKRGAVHILNTGGRSLTTICTGYNNNVKTT